MHGLSEATIEFDEQVLIIPVDDVISISYRTGYKKGASRVVSNRPVDEQTDCCTGCANDCYDSFCACCCGPRALPRTEDSNVNFQAQRSIIISIEYVRYRKLQLPSATRSMKKPTSFDPDNMVIEIIHFYLIDVNEYDQTKIQLSTKSS